MNIKAKHLDIIGYASLLVFLLIVEGIVFGVGFSIGEIHAHEHPYIGAE